jgi:AAA family ATP:ADP antiporter
MSTSQPNAEFTGLRARFWPIHNHELKKFLPLGFIMFCILFNYTLLRDTKDTLVVNAAGAGVIPFLKAFCVTPASILFVIIYAKLTNSLSRENVFYAVVTPFLVFFGAFAFIIYPNLAQLHPTTETVQALQASYPSLSGLIDVYAYWAYSLFYVLSEIWGSAMLALLFWQFANYVVRIKESKRFYGLFAVIGNASLIFSGQTVTFCSHGIQQFYATKEEAWQVSLYLLMGTVVVMGLIAMGLYRWMYTNVLNDKRYFDPEEGGIPKKKKEKLSFMSSVKLIFKSKELGLITILLLAYGITINLVEVQWKHQLKLYSAGDQGTYNGFMGNYSTFTGIFAILFGLFAGSSILQKYSWFKAAIVTPMVFTIGGGLFFAFIYFQDLMAPFLSFISTTPVVAATFLGAFIIAISKSIKYMLFDPTKEMAYIPLDDELKTKGKAAVDVIGGRGGKSGGALVQTALLSIGKTKDVMLIIFPAFSVFLIICFAWIWAVGALSKRVEAAIALRKDHQK